MEIDPALFRQMVEALKNSQESLTYFCHEHPDDDAGFLALLSVNNALEALKKAGH